MGKNQNRTAFEFKLTIKHIYKLDFSLDEIEDAFIVIKYEQENE